jgi:hypothetical protein
MGGGCPCSCDRSVARAHLVTPVAVLDQADAPRHKCIVPIIPSRVAQSSNPGFDRKIHRLRAWGGRASITVACFDMGLLCGGLMGSSPERSGDDGGRLDPPLCQACSYAADLLERPADEVWSLRSWFCLFGGVGSLAWWRITASIANVCITSDMWRCQPCHRRPAGLPIHPCKGDGQEAIPGSVSRCVSDPVRSSRSRSCPR